jgi:SAM-dependent methyltransferase
MKLSDEHVRSYIDDIRYVELLRFLTWNGDDVCPTWKGAYQPATNSNDAELFSLANFNRDHYLFYRALVERHVEKRGRILDVGCGTGARTLMLSRYSDYTTGVDASNGRIVWVAGDFMEMSTTEKFDYIFAVEVIEHINPPDHAAFILKTTNMLLDGGAAMLTTPKDENPERKVPHIGLWYPEDAARLAEKFNGELEYFDHRKLMHGGENPWSEEQTATHYVMTVRK